MVKAMEYKGYHARLEYDADDRCFVGEVIGINDVIVFSGTSTEELEGAFRESIDGYLDMCIRQGKTPDKEYSGQFVLRTGSTLHKKLAQVASQRNESLNTLAVEACEAYLAQA
jgi:predicted HicB family RNase H-like nuclease